MQGAWIHPSRSHAAGHLEGRAYERSPSPLPADAFLTFVVAGDGPFPWDAARWRALTPAPGRNPCRGLSRPLHGTDAEAGPDARAATSAGPGLPGAGHRRSSTRRIRAEVARLIEARDGYEP